MAAAWSASPWNTAPRVTHRTQLRPSFGANRVAFASTSSVAIRRAGTSEKQARWCKSGSDSSVSISEQEDIADDIQDVLSKSWAHEVDESSIDDNLRHLNSCLAKDQSSAEANQLYNNDLYQRPDNDLKEVPKASIPRSIFLISFISMALTSASCVFNTLLPIYMVTELNVTMRSMGMFEGVLEAFSYLVRMFSGVISDKLPSRKGAILLGFSMSAAAKFNLSGATTLGQIFVGKALDKLANGVQAAPRDALIGDLSPPPCRSACYGLAQSLRKWGSAVGAVLAFCLMKASNENYRMIFLLAASVSALSCFAFAAFVPAHSNGNRSSSTHRTDKKSLASDLKNTTVMATAHYGRRFLRGVGDSLKDITKIGGDFYRVLMIIGLYALGNVNEALLELRAIEVGFARAESALVIALLCFVIFVCAYPLGRFTDKHGHKILLGLGMCSLIMGDMILLVCRQSKIAILMACVFLGVHWAIMQGPLLSVVVGLSPPHLRGTAFGVYYTVMAMVAMLANSVSGQLWHSFGAPVAFGCSAGVATFTLLLLPWWITDTKRSEAPQTKLLNVGLVS